MTFAERLGYRPPFSNPCRGIERFREHKRKRPLSEDELRRLWRHLSQPNESEPLDNRSAETAGVDRLSEE